MYYVITHKNNNTAIGQSSQETEKAAGHDCQSPYGKEFVDSGRRPSTKGVVTDTNALYDVQDWQSESKTVKTKLPQL